MVRYKQLRLEGVVGGCCWGGVSEYVELPDYYEKLNPAFKELKPKVFKSKPEWLVKKFSKNDLDLPTVFDAGSNIPARRVLISTRLNDLVPGNTHISLKIREASGQTKLLKNS